MISTESSFEEPALVIEHSLDGSDHQNSNDDSKHNTSQSGSKKDQCNTSDLSDSSKENEKPHFPNKFEGDQFEQSLPDESVQTLGPGCREFFIDGYSILTFETKEDLLLHTLKQTRGGVNHSTTSCSSSSSITKQTSNESAASSTNKTVVDAADLKQEPVAPSGRIKRQRNLDGREWVKRKSRLCMESSPPSSAPPAKHHKEAGEDTTGTANVIQTEPLQPGPIERRSKSPVKRSSVEVGAAFDDGEQLHTRPMTLKYEPRSDNEDDEKQPNAKRPSLKLSQSPVQAINAVWPRGANTPVNFSTGLLIRSMPMNVTPPPPPAHCTPQLAAHIELANFHYRPPGPANFDRNHPALMSCQGLMKLDEADDEAPINLSCKPIINSHHVHPPHHHHQSQQGGQVYGPRPSLVAPFPMISSQNQANGHQNGRFNGYRPQQQPPSTQSAPQRMPYMASYPQQQPGMPTSSLAVNTRIQPNCPLPIANLAQPLYPIPSYQTIRMGRRLTSSDAHVRCAWYIYNCKQQYSSGTFAPGFPIKPNLITHGNHLIRPVAKQASSLIAAAAAAAAANRPGQQPPCRPPPQHHAPQHQQMMTPLRQSPPQQQQHQMMDNCGGKELAQPSPQQMESMRNMIMHFIQQQQFQSQQQQPMPPVRMPQAPAPPPQLSQPPHHSQQHGSGGVVNMTAGTPPNPFTAAAAPPRPDNTVEWLYAAFAAASSLSAGHQQQQLPRPANGNY